MSARTPTRLRILLLVRQAEQRQLLRDLLQPRWLLSEGAAGAELQGAFDLAIFDRPALSALQQAAWSRREAERPVFLPMVLLLPRGQDLAGDEALWRCVDEVIGMPVAPPLLLKRVEILLRTRSLATELAQQRERLAAISREKDELIGIAAHDLRNPVSAVLMATRLLREGQLSADERRQVVDTAHAAAMRMMRMLNDILDVERVERGRVTIERVRQPLAPIVAACVANLVLLAEQKRIRVLLEDRAPGIEAHVDETRVEEIFGNLISNAVKYSHPGSVVRVIVDQGEGGGARVSVADEGIGIRAEHHSRVFSKFSRFGTPTGGEASTGLGLAIVKKLVDLHQGTVDFDSVAGQGTTFVVSFPPVPSRDGA